jgi:hypothetical protein
MIPPGERIGSPRARRGGAAILASLGLLFLLAVGVSSCVGTTRPDPMAGMDGSGGSVSLRVTNMSFNDATVTVIRSGSRSRLGVVSGKGTALYTVPWAGVQELRLHISLLASGTYTTPPVTISSGERLELVVEENLRLSSLRRF